MLCRLQISDLAVVDAVEVELGPGMTALTGETGAGKSILVDAVAFALGARADSRAVRAGCDRCNVTATFDISARPDIERRLAEQDLDADGECILRRVITADGRSRGYVNGNSVPMQTLRAVGDLLVDICGQQAHQSLRHPAAQRDLLDAFGDHGALLDDMATTFARWRELHERLQVLESAGQDRAAQLELLEFQVAELRDLQLAPDELESLERDRALAANAGRIAAATHEAVEALYAAESGSAHGLIGESRRRLAELAAFDPALQASIDMLAEAEILVGEAADTLRQHTDSLEHDPARQERIEQRLDAIHDLARKHRVTPVELPAFTERLAAELDEVERTDEQLDDLRNEADRAAVAARVAASALGDARRTAAASLGEQVTAHLAELGMPDGRFEVGVEPVPEDRLGPAGAERVEFTVALNPGQPTGPLARIASGGELSRVSLALQDVAMRKAGVPTLIFDEVDAGVGGGVAEIVGTRLAKLGRDRQVLCVTHLPQVASQAGQHMRIVKTSDDESTRTTVTRLDDAGRVDEIARMLGGVRITARTRAHAEEMLG